MKRLALIIASLLVTGVQVSLAVTVSGRVTDASGNPVSHALVQALERPQGSVPDGAVGSKLNPWVHADDQGQFQLQLAPGRYKILAKDEIDGYPDPLPLLNSDPTAQFPVITVNGADIRDLQVILGQRGSSMTGQVIDNVTKKAVPGAQVLIADPNNPQAFVKLTADSLGHFRFTVLPKRVRISASAPGYTPAVPQEDVTLVQGETRQMTIGVKRK